MCAICGSVSLASCAEAMPDASSNAANAPANLTNTMTPFDGHDGRAFACHWMRQRSKRFPKLIRKGASCSGKVRRASVHTRLRGCPHNLQTGGPDHHGVTRHRDLKAFSSLSAKVASVFTRVPSRSPRQDCRRRDKSRQGRGLSHPCDTEPHSRGRERRPRCRERPNYLHAQRN
jgi:hypothetical protein